MSARTQRRQQTRRNRKPQPPIRRSHLWRYVAAVAFLLLSTFGALAASNHATKALARVSAKASNPVKAVAAAATPTAAPLTVAAYVPSQANDNPAPSSPSASPASSPPGGGDWILAPDDLPPTPPTGDVPPLPVAHSAQDLGFHPVKVQHMDCVGDRVILTCLNPETGTTETITGKQGRDTVFTLKNPEAADLPTSQIKDVEPGNLVATRNPQTGKTEFGRVVRTIQRQTDALVTVRLADSKTGQAASSLTCTPEHPYYVQGQGWVEAGSLGIGSSIVTRAGPPLVVQGVDWQRAKDGTKPFTVYNFEVAGDHTYFVGNDNGGTWVHNQCGPDPANLGELMEGAPLKTTQGNVSRELVNNYTDMLLKDGSEAPPIKVDGDTIVEGNHRYIADQLARLRGYNGPPLRSVPGASPSNPGPVIPWGQVNWY